MLTAQQIGKLKAGDKVWVGNPSRVTRELATVTRVTETLVLTGEGRFDRFRKANGRAIHNGMYASYILDLASEADVKQWEKDKAAEKRKNDAAQRERERQEATRKELCDLFNGVAFVQRNGNKFSVEFDSLSEDEVRDLAKLVRK